MFVPLYIKTNNSILSSLIKIDELISYAKKVGIKALTITDENMYGAYDFYKACKKNDIKPIIGLEVKIIDTIIIIINLSFYYLHHNNNMIKRKNLLQYFVSLN